MSLPSATTNVGHRVANSVGQRTHRVRTPAFYLVTLLFLGFLAVALRETIPMAGTAWFADYGFPIHRVHHLLIGSTLAVFIATIAVQLYRPARRIGALQGTLAFVTAAFALTAVASGIGAAGELLVFVVPVVIIALLHPTRHDLVPRLARLDRRLLTLALPGAVAFWVVAAGEYASHTTLGDEHVLFGHYEFTLFALVTIGLFALLATFRPIGWRALVYGAALLATVFAVGSLAFPGAEQGSALGTVPAVAVLVWAVAFVVLAESVNRSQAESSADGDGKNGDEDADLDENENTTVASSA